MSVLAAIDDFITDAGVVVTRHATGSFVNGIYTPGAPTTFTIDVVAEPAYNLNRVIGGADLEAKVDLQHVTEIYQVWTRFALQTRSLNTDPDTLAFRGNTWVVVRVEVWIIDGEPSCHAVITRETFGDS
jgi:hypothetical protein